MKFQPAAFKNINWKDLSSDFSAGLVVFLVAVPLCLGIALASGAPFSSGLIAGIIGGLVVPLVSRSQLGVAGPAAGLTAVVLLGIEKIGFFEGFLVAVVIAGAVQILLGLLRAGSIAYFFPSSVIKGMLSAIGLILILKQLPHALGYDLENIASDSFVVGENENTFTLFYHAFQHIEWGAVIISTVSLLILIFWSKTPLQKIRWMPAALVVVVLGVLLNMLFEQLSPELSLGTSHLVNLPRINSPADFLAGFTFPDFSVLAMREVWVVGLTIGIIASIESLLTIEAVDKLDPYKRKSPLNRELLAQGLANTIAGLVGGLPVTSVIVRSTAGISAGAKTRVTAFAHGIFLLLSVMFLSFYLSLVPMASLAAILLMVGYKLAKPSIFKAMYSSGWSQFIPFLATVVAILLTDLLKGITIGVAIGLSYVIRTNFHSSVNVIRNKKNILIKFNRDVSFLNKSSLINILEKIENGSSVLVDGTKARFIDYDISEILHEFRKEATLKNITVEFKNISTIKSVKTKTNFIEV